MATESAGPGAAAPSTRHTMGWLGVASMIAAILCIVIFSFALANVTMRLQRHITARAQWAADRQKMASAYASLLSAAAANDSLAYGLVLHFAWDDIRALKADSRAMAATGDTERQAFLQQAQQCLPGTLSAFKATPPAAFAACKVLVAARA